MVVNKSLFQSLQSNQNSAILAQTTKGPSNQSFPATNSVKTIIQKPQRLFEDKIDNSYLPFVPKIRKKPNALRPLPGTFFIKNFYFLFLLFKFFKFLKIYFRK